MIWALMWNVGTCRSDVKGKLKWKTHKSESTEAGHKGGITCKTDEVSVMEMEERGYTIQLRLIGQPEMGGISGSSKAV